MFGCSSQARPAPTIPATRPISMSSWISGGELSAGIGRPFPLPCRAGRTGAPGRRHRGRPLPCGGWSALPQPRRRLRHFPFLKPVWPACRSSAAIFHPSARPEAPTSPLPVEARPDEVARILLEFFSQDSVSNCAHAFAASTPGVKLLRRALPAAAGRGRCMRRASLRRPVFPALRRSGPRDPRLRLAPALLAGRRSRRKSSWLASSPSERMRPSAPARPVPAR